MTDTESWLYGHGEPCTNPGNLDEYIYPSFHQEYGLGVGTAVDCPEWPEWQSVGMESGPSGCDILADNNMEYDYNYDRLW